MSATTSNSRRLCNGRGQVIPGPTLPEAVKMGPHAIRIVVGGLGEGELSTATTVHGPERASSSSAPPEMASAALPEAVAPKKKGNVRFAFACAILASMTSILLGYDIGVMSGASLYIKKDFNISDGKVEVLMGILNLYSLIGSFAAGRTSDWIGRRYTIVFAAVIFFAGAFLMGFAVNYAMLMFGRFVAGIGVGYALMIAPVYTAEVSPASARGFLTSFPEVFINFGILLGYVSNYAFSRLPLNLGWRIMLGIGAAPSVLLALMVLGMPESPRWLVMKGRLADAKVVLEKTSDTAEEAAERLADIKAAAGIPEELDGDVVTVPKRGSGNEKRVWKELILSPTPAMRRILLSGIGIHFFQQASGIDSVVLYSPRVFKSAGITDDKHLLGTTCAVGVTKTLFILVATFFLDRVGRRPLLLSSTGGMILSLIGLGAGLTVVGQHPDAKIPWAIGLSIASTLAYVAFFSIGLGPITWVYSSEIFPLQVRALGCSLGVAANRVTSGVISMTFLSLSKAITIGGSFFLYSGIAALAWVFFYTYLPETRGRTLEEMSKLFGDTAAASESDEPAKEKKKVEMAATN
ncbi:Os07g0582400 [Oryza sativa Japonica Group]|uniref:Os07g0582400 protein n=4 Tax=Oryza sativa TaxID=4530 RepID=Q0D551_ORYSJ|nr:putative sugar transporter [Oryza sativa]BAF22022.1 Os07g0582400 [Oryza sativa Japonica Group]|eukprot:NP_001060108.1 Os07g0582400 [Oryza sativa Japonica Group]